MPISLKCKLKKLNHDGSLTNEEYEDLLKKLDGHDKQIREEVIQDIRVEIANRIPSRPITKRAIEVWEDKYWLLINLDKKLEQMHKEVD